MALLMTVPLVMAMCWTSAAHAADEGKSLYWWDGDKVVKVDTPSSVIDLGYDRSNTYACVKLADGSTAEVYPNGTKNPIASRAECDFTKSLPHAVIPGHSQRDGVGSLDAGLLRPSGDMANTIKSVSVDSSGRLWIRNDDGISIQQNSDELEFDQVEEGIALYSMGGSNLPFGKVLLLTASPRVQSNAAVVQNMPSSGDPAASWNQSLAYLLAGLAVGAGVVVLRRRPAV